MITPQQAQQITRAWKAPRYHAEFPAPIGYMEKYVTEKELESFGLTVKDAKRDQAICVGDEFVPVDGIGSDLYRKVYCFDVAATVTRAAMGQAEFEKLKQEKKERTL